MLWIINKWQQFFAIYFLNSATHFEVYSVMHIAIVYSYFHCFVIIHWVNISQWIHSPNRLFPINQYNHSRETLWFIASGVHVWGFLWAFFVGVGWLGKAVYAWLILQNVGGFILPPTMMRILLASHPGQPFLLSDFLLSTFANLIGMKWYLSLWF
jgi:hypothetical protein